MAEKAFRDTLCESRSYNVETTDPTGARTIDELRRSVKELRATLEAERIKNRKLVREHEKQLQHIREEDARRLDAALEACGMRKEQEKSNELKKLEDKLKKQEDLAIRQLAKKKEDELNKSFRKWNHDKQEAIRVAVETERRLSMEDLQASFAEEEALARESKLTREVFILGEQNSTLEEQVRNLSRLNRAQIDQMRRIKQECDAKIENFLRQHKMEASREMAQLKLAEQIIAEKDHDLHAISYRADMAVMEKAALEEEIVAMKSTQNTSFHDTSQFESSPVRRSLGGGSLVQKRVEELESQIRKLEEEKGGLKQDNASLRKKLLRDEGEKKSGDEEKIKSLRKKNTELTVLSREQEDKIKVLRAENDQLQKAKSTPGESDQNVRKVLARQHAKDISDYTKQIHGKDRELTDLRKRLAKLEAAARTHSEPPPELEKKLKTMAMEKLRMERLITKLYSRLPDVVNMEDLSRKDLVSESSRVEQLAAENQSLQARVRELQEAVPPPAGVSVEEKEELLAEIARLKELSRSASKLESECIALRKARDSLEAANGPLEQKCHELSQQLQISTLAVRELEDAQRHQDLASSHGTGEELERQVEMLKGQLEDAQRRQKTSSRTEEELERQVEALSGETQELREQLELKGDKMTTLEEEFRKTSAQLVGKQAVIDVLQKKVEELEGLVQEKEELTARLETSLNVHTDTKPSIQTADVGIQSHRTAEPAMPPEATQKIKSRSDSPSKRFPKERIRSPVRRGMRSPRTSSGDLLDSSLDNEMRAAGIDVNDSFDSSEGIGFSEASILESDHSLAMREEGGGSSVAASKKFQHDSSPSHHHHHRTAWEEDQAQATTNTPTGDSREEAEEMVDGGHSALGDEEKGVSNGRGLNKEVSSPDKDSDGSHTPKSDNFKVGVYIAKFSYDPASMSPNQNYDLELPLTAGDYLYVYGEMDDDGFYHGQLLTGQSGMIPSNFIEMVDEEDSSHTPQKPQRRGESNLQDIEELDEDASSSTGLVSVLPPSLLTLERQFVEGGLYSVALQWTPPHPLPAGATGYCVYVNGEYKCNVSGADQHGVLLTAIQRQQLVKISVRTTTEEGESSDPSKLVILNPQYPEPPTNVKVTLSHTPPCLMVHWVPSKPLKEGNPIDGYAVCLNGQNCVQLGPNPKPVKSVCAQVLVNDIREMKEKLLKADVVLLTVCAVSGEYFSAYSLPVVVSREDLLSVYGSGKMTADESEITSSATSLSSIDDEEEKEVYNPVKGVEHQSEGEELQPQAVDIVTVEDINVSNGVSVPANGTAHEQERHTVPLAYYRALASYDPQLQSPNEDAADEELGFQENDLIIGLDPVDMDGFIYAELNGRRGYIPSNLVDEVTDKDELSRMEEALQEQSARGSSLSRQLSINGDREGSHTMKALFDYDPARDSPNANSEVELAITEGDNVTVFGKPDGNGFFKAEVAGKRGLVPCNFLEDTTPGRNDGIEVFAADEDSMRIADRIIHKADVQSETQTKTKNSGKTTNQKQHKGGIFSRGKSLLTKSGGKQRT